MFFRATAQNNAIDTIWFRVPNVSIVDDGLFDALDSILLVYPKESPKSIKKLVWNIVFLDEDIDCDSESKMDIIMVPSDFIIPIMRMSDGFFFYKGNLFFVEKRKGKEKKYNDIIEYSDKSRSFYYITIKWDQLWNSSLEESIKNQLVSKYASIEDYPSVLLKRDSGGLWKWRLSEL